MKKLLILAIAAILAAFAVSCQTPSHCCDDPLSHLVDVVWLPLDLPGIMPTNIPDGANVVFTEDSRISGYAGGNTFSAVCLLSADHTISISTVVTTKVATLPSVTRYEQALLNALRQAKRFQLDSNKLVFFDAKEKRLLTLIKRVKF